MMKKTIHPFWKQKFIIHTNGSMLVHLYGIPNLNSYKDKFNALKLQFKEKPVTKSFSFKTQEILSVHENVTKLKKRYKNEKISNVSINEKQYKKDLPTQQILCANKKKWNDTCEHFPFDFLFKEKIQNQDLGKKNEPAENAKIFSMCSVKRFSNTKRQENTQKLLKRNNIWNLDTDTFSNSLWSGNMNLKNTEDLDTPLSNFKKRYSK